MQKKDYKEYQKTIKETKKILSFDNELRKIFGSKKKLVREVFKIAEKQMSALAEEKSVNPSREERKKIKRVVELFLDVATTKPIDSFFQDLATRYLLVIFNWNKSLVQDQAIERQIKATEAIVKGHTTIMHAINVLKKVTKQAKDVSSYEPPAFDLSKHYLKSLQDKAVKENKDSKKDKK